jgi:hypothetical protein
MKYRIFADLVVIMHFLWILFILFGFCITVYWVILKRKYLDMLIFRVVHLCGILYVGLLTILGKYCPLTVFEYNLKQKYNSSATYSGSFIVDWIEKLVYPEVNPLVVQIPTIMIAISTITIFLFFPPKIKSKKFE